MPDELEKEIHDAASVEDALPALGCLLSNGDSVWTDGSLHFIKELVGRVNGLSFHIYPKDQPPPHLHIRGGGLDASFCIQNCRRLKGSIDSRRHALLKWWHQRAKHKLEATWERLSG